MVKMARPPKTPPGDKPTHRKHRGRLIRIREKQLVGIDLIAFRDGVDATEVVNSLIRDSLARLGLFPPERMSEEWVEEKKRKDAEQTKNAGQ